MPDEFKNEYANFNVSQNSFESSTQDEALCLEGCVFKVLPCVKSSPLSVLLLVDFQRSRMLSFFNAPCTRLTVISLVLLIKVNDRFPYPRNFFRYIRRWLSEKSNLCRLVLCGAERMEYFAADDNNQATRECEIIRWVCQLGCLWKGFVSPRELEPSNPTAALPSLFFSFPFPSLFNAYRWP